MLFFSSFVHIFLFEFYFFFCLLIFLRLVETFTLQWPLCRQILFARARWTSISLSLCLLLAHSLFFAATEVIIEPQQSREHRFSMCFLSLSSVHACALFTRAQNTHLNSTNNTINAFGFGWNVTWNRSGSIFLQFDWSLFSSRFIVSSFYSRAAYIQHFRLIQWRFRWFKIPNIPSNQVEKEKCEKCKFQIQRQNLTGDSERTSCATNHRLTSIDRTTKKKNTKSNSTVQIDRQAKTNERSFRRYFF